MNIFVADIGSKKAHIYNSGADIFYGNLDDIDLIDMKIPGIKEGDYLIVEDAHLRESHKNTLAQAYSYNQLVEFKQNANRKGITILCFPQKSTPKARKLTGVLNGCKSDEVDTRAIAGFVTKDSNAFNSLKEFVPVTLKEYQEQNQHIFEYIQQANEDINPAKSSKYGLGKIDYEDEVSKWIKKYAVKGGMTLYGYVPSICEYLNYDEDLMSAIGLKFDKSKKKLNVITTTNRIYTIVNSILRPNGELRLRSDVQKPPYWKFVKANYFGMKPFHMNQGVAASTYKHYMRPAVSGYTNKTKETSRSSDFTDNMTWEDYDQLKKERTKVDKKTQKIWYALRRMIIEDGLR